MPDVHAYQENVPSRMKEHDFIACFSGVYEHSPWIAKAVWQKGSERGLGADQDTAEQISQVFQSVVDDSSEQTKLALLNAHPDLAGKLAIAGGLTADSKAEQADAGLGSCSAEEFADFNHLNDRYKTKFGFPFILAVRGYQIAEILDIFRDRIENDTTTEFQEALSQVHRIALLRLREIK